MGIHAGAAMARQMLHNWHHTTGNHTFSGGSGKHGNFVRPLAVGPVADHFISPFIKNISVRVTVDIDAQIDQIGRHKTGMDLNEILKAAVQHGASDVHIVPWRPPYLRIDGKMRALSVDPLSPDETKSLILGALREELIERFKRDGELDTSYEMGDARFRLNVLEQNDGYGAVLRVIPTEIPTPEFLGLDQVMLDLTKLPRGIVLVTGPTGSGKSTTLASMINIINAERKGHILTIEDPIEYIYPKLGCVVTQREIGTHSKSFQDSLKRAMRQDPDVILVGEMRDLETISAALTLAETGHLVFSTLHTTDAAQTVDRIIDVFPPHQQSQIRAQLSFVLEGILCQSLLPRANGHGRALSMEVLVPNAAIRNLIREDKVHQIYSAMQVGQERFGMQTFNQSLATLYFKKQITIQVALSISSNPDELQEMINRGAGSIATSGGPQTASARGRQGGRK